MGLDTSWRSPKDFEGDGAQIDLLFERDDDAIDICEIKYAHKIYTFDKETAKSLNHKAECLDRHLGGDRQIFLHMITPPWSQSKHFIQKNNR